MVLLIHLLQINYYKSCVSSMIHSAIPTVSTITNIVFTLFCFARFWKVGTNGRTYRQTPRGLMDQQYLQTGQCIETIFRDVSDPQGGCGGPHLRNISKIHTPKKRSSLVKKGKADPKKNLIISLPIFFRFHSIDPLGQPTITAGSDHCFHTWYPYVLWFSQFEIWLITTNVKWKQCSLLERLWVWPSGSLMTLTPVLSFVFVGMIAK